MTTSHLPEPSLSSPSTSTAMADSPPVMRKTRFVCVSDTHNATPNGSFKLPKGDVLIHAGDMTNQGTLSELKKTIKWIEEADFEAKIVIAGNHDITLDSDFYAQHGLYFHNQNPQDPAKCQELLEEAPSILWLKHEHAVIDLVSPTGPQTTFKIFGSPFSPAQGRWAFGYGPDEAAQLWDRIPLDTDIVVTHTPPKYHCDERSDRRAVGCEGLREVLWRVRPRLAISGHVHESRGAERVRWDLGTSNLKYIEHKTVPWEDPGRNNKKLSIIDLTTKGGTPLENDGSVGDIPSGVTARNNIVRDPVFLPLNDGEPLPKSSKPSAKVGVSQVATQLLAIPTPSLPPATYGLGGVPPSARCDLEALSGRMGRQETCIVNAAIMAASWPRSEAKKFNKPIVIDIDLQVWKKG